MAPFAPELSQFLRLKSGPLSTGINGPLYSGILTDKPFPKEVLKKNNKTLKNLL